MKEKTKKEKKPQSIGRIVALLLICLGLLVTLGCSTVGYLRYTSIMEKLYNDKAYDIAYTAIDNIDADKVEEWFTTIRSASDSELATVSEEIQKDPDYQEYLALLSSLREKMEANYVYIADMTRVDGQVTDEIIYMMDADNPDDPYPAFIPGDVGGMNPDFLADSQVIYDTGERSDNYFYSHSAFGYNTSAIAAIQNSKGETIGVLGVEIAMSNLQHARTAYIVWTIAVSLVIMALFVTVDYSFIRKTIIRPLNKVIDEAQAFAKSENKVSEELPNIKTNNEIETLASSILQMENDINEYIFNITAITAEKERIGAELNVATKIQSSMLPREFPDREEFEIYATMDPAKEVGGDFYDYFMVDDTHLAIVMADVSGKGVPAALFMVIGKTLIKDHTVPGRDLGEVFTEVNNLLCEANSEDLFITAFEGVLDLETGEFSFVNAGHELPFISKKGEDFEVYKTNPKFVLAGIEDMQYQSGNFFLAPGDKIFQYTDGVTEATSADLELFGMDRLRDSLNTMKNQPTEVICKNLKHDIDEFVGAAPQFDDITTMCLEFKKRYGSEE